MSSKISVAIIGAGNMARAHIAAFQDIPEVEILGIHSRGKEKAAALAKEFCIPGVFDSIEALYSGTDARLVIIAVPELSARDVCLQAFGFPWTLLIEKPVGYNLADARLIAQAAREQKRNAYVGLNRRHYHSTQATLKALSEVKGRRLIHLYDQEDPERALAAGQPELVVRNWMYANSIHMIDFLRIFGRGEITRVDPIISWNPERPDFVISKIQFSSGDVGIYEAIWNGPGPWAVVVTTQEKRWELRPVERAGVQPRASRTLELYPEHEWDKKFKPGLRLQAEETLKAVNNLPASLPTLDDALQTMELVNNIYGV